MGLNVENGKISPKGSIYFGWHQTLFTNCTFY